METLYLITWDHCYADEFNIFGYDIISEDYKKALLNAIDEFLKENPDEERPFCFGTNEEIYLTFDEIKQILNSARIIDNNEFNVLHKLFGVHAGQCLMDQIEDFLYDLNYFKLK